MSVPHDPAEIVAVVDEHDRPVGTATRRDVHDSHLLHREAATLLFNSRDEVLLQCRADNRRWDYSAAGHFPYRQSYRDGAVREIAEELGITVLPEELEELGKRRVTNQSGTNDRFVMVFKVQKELPLEAFSPDPHEVAEVRYFSRSDLRTLFSANGERRITTSCRESLEKYFL